MYKERCLASPTFSAVAQSCPTLCDPMNRSKPGLPVHHQLPEFTETHVHRVSDAIQPSHSLSSPSPPAPNLSQHQSLFQWVNSAWSGQSTGVSALASFLPKKSQGRSPSELYAHLKTIFILFIFGHAHGLRELSSLTRDQTHVPCSVSAEI